MAKKVLISGGSGMIGSAAGRMLKDSGYDVAILSRSGSDKDFAKTFNWDVKNRNIGKEALEDIHALVNLAGASIAGKRWTSERKEEIRKSRTESTNLLFESLSKMKHKPEVVVSASAVGFYGHDTGGILMEEDRKKPGDDFMASVTRAWEEEALRFQELGIRLVILRIGVVLSKEGGALPRMSLPVKFGLGAPLASGDQYISWIHIEDLARIIQYSIENMKIKGIYNAVAPEPVTNREFNKIMANVLKRPLFLPPVPAFVLRLVFGEMASVVTGGNRVSSRKIQEQGFVFSHPKPDDALRDLLK